MATTRRPTTDARRSRSRQAIVAATSKVLSERGYNLMTVEDILSEAGVARATFYSHFTDKNDVTRAVIEQMFLRAKSLYVSFSQIEEVTRDTVTAWLNDAYDQWRDYQSEVSALVREFATLFRSPQFTQLDEFAEAMVGDGRHFACSQNTALLRARLLIVQLERAMLDSASGLWPCTKSELIAELVPIWLETLQRPQA